MKYLILGSEGQIGKPLVAFLKKMGHEVLEYDLRRNPHEDLRYLDSDKEIKNTFIEKIKKCDFIFFLAFDVGGK